MIQEFSQYITQGIVRKITPDSMRAQSLLMDSQRKLAVLDRQVQALGIDDQLANEYIVLCYDIIMLCIRSKLYQNGFVASGLGAHEAEVAYLQELDISQKDILFMDQLHIFEMECSIMVNNLMQSMHKK